MKAKSKELLNDSMVIDILWHTMLEDTPPECAPEKTIIDLLLESGVNTVSTTIKSDLYNDVDFKDCCREIFRYYLLEETFPEKVKIIRTYDDILDAFKEEKLGVIMSTQGADVIERDVRFISILYELGLRIIQITYNHQGYMGCGVYEPVDTGLTGFGQQAILEMNRLGMVVDLSHVGYKTSLDAIETSLDPVIFSHSNVKKLCNNPRNITDEQIKAAASKGGVIGLCPHAVFTSNDHSKQPDINDFIDHIVYISDLVGIDYVGIGTDRFVRPTLPEQMGRKEFNRSFPGFNGPFDAYNKQVKGFKYYGEWGNFVEGMLKRDFSEDEIRKVLGGNIMRIFKQVWNKKDKKVD